MSKKNITTLKQIAEELNLSISTVSRALNDHPDISLKTKEKVISVSKKFNYAPNLFAKGFRSHKTNIIGVIVPNIAHYFTSTLLKGVISEAEIHGYKIIISESRNNVQKEAEMLETMKQFGVDGILLSLVRKTHNVDSILKVLEHIPLVLFDKVSTKVPCTQVVIDDEDAAFRAVEHLINTGKKRIAIIKETEKSFNSEKRFAGYLRALKNYNLEIDENLILSTEDISMHQGKRLTSILLSLQNRPDGVFAVTDGAAIGVIKTLKKHKIKIPEEIGVVGFSNSENSIIIEPKLTTIDQPGHRIGEVAFRALINEINNNDNTVNNKTIVIKTNIIVRESSFKSLVTT
ncbi:LacI family DNA-binding transcriptional regulator [Lutibacter sp. B1]|uniref:LacI family DNA-binding transcriptional regulator n=1 Tax=Lutibacter sp. B1 TaxID=2725996 RepID=UPI001456A262|nr:LacI family DNA-binding transcriptional regulator [Lutibacter sp. B1]NLP58098.1 LacI family transcriptional regulator [Lutibacter sp. B1]